MPAPKESPTTLMEVRILSLNQTHIHNAAHDTKSEHQDKNEYKKYKKNKWTVIQFYLCEYDEHSGNTYDKKKSLKTIKMASLNWPSS